MKIKPKLLREIFVYFFNQHTIEHFFIDTRIYYFLYYLFDTFL